MSPSSEQPPAAFLSYVHSDDETEEGRISEFRSRLEREVAMQTGGTFKIFQDRFDIQWGAAWGRRIEESLNHVTFLIPIITPSYFTSAACRQEFDLFLRREQQLGRHDLILPIYYVESPRVEVEEIRKRDKIAQVISARQYIDWRNLRFETFASPEVARKLAEIARQIAAAITEAERFDGPPPAVADGLRTLTTFGSAMSMADIGLAQIFNGFGECQDEILHNVAESRSIKIFVQMAKSVLSGSAIIYDALERSQDNAEIKILHAGMDSPYLSERVALNRGSNYQEWREDVQYVTSIGRRLRSRLGPRLELRQHSEGYMWRAFIFDDTAYMQPYLYSSDNARRAPVLKLTRKSRVDDITAQDNPNSLFHMLTNYFDLKWEECAPTPTRLADMITPGDATAVAALVRQAGTWVFVIPKRFLSLDGEELPFHSIGGKRRADETWIAALQREATEEIGAQLEIKSCTQTREITTSAEFEPLALIDRPQPYCVYKRTRSIDPEVVEPEILWIVGFEAELPAAAKIEPRSEIAAVLYLSQEMLRRAARERITYAQIRRAKDGSGVDIQDGVDFDYKRVAVPTGLAALPTFGASR